LLFCVGWAKSLHPGLLVAQIGVTLRIRAHLSHFKVQNASTLSAPSFGERINKNEAVLVEIYAIPCLRLIFSPSFNHHLWTIDKKAFLVPIHSENLCNQEDAIRRKNHQKQPYFIVNDIFWHEGKIFFSFFAPGHTICCYKHPSFFPSPCYHLPLLD